MNAKKMALFVMDRSGFAWLLRPLYAGLGVIVGLHRIVSAGQASLMPGNDISVDLLARTLAFFRRANYDFIHLSEVPDRLQTRSRNRFVVFTFDDGFVDTLTHGLPLFRAFDAPFTVFVVTGIPDAVTIPWWVVAESLVLENSRLSLDGPQGVTTFSCSTFSEKRRTYTELTRWGFRDAVGLSQALSNACDRLGVSVGTIVNQAMMSWEQLRELNHDRLVTIGVHSVSHFGLTTLSDNEAFEEIAVAQNRLKAELGSSICHIAYPFGWFGAREVQIVRDLGFETGVTVKRGVIHPEHRNNLYVLPRILPSMAPHGGMSFVRASAYGLWNEMANFIEART